MKLHIPDLPKYLRTYITPNIRCSITLDSFLLDEVCTVLVKDVMAPFYKNRNKIYFEKCCWSFSKLKKKDKESEHTDRVLLNDHFKFKDRDNLEMKVREFLITQGQGTMYLQDNKMVVPFINRPHHFLKSETTALEQLLEKRAIEFKRSLSTLKIKLQEESRKREQLQEVVDELLGKRMRDQESISKLTNELECQREKLSLLEYKVEWLLPSDSKSSSLSDAGTVNSEYLNRKWGNTY